MTKIYRYEVPVDDRWHKIDLRGFIVHVDCRDPRIVEFWAIHFPDTRVETREFIVVGTGHDWPDDTSWVGTTVTPGGALVWHLLERYMTLEKEEWGG